MKLRCENVGLIKDAEIEIDGITVIAGENGTGKSTFSKSLYAFFCAFHNLEENANSLFKSNIRDSLSSLRQPYIFNMYTTNKNFIEKRNEQIRFLKISNDTIEKLVSIENSVERIMDVINNAFQEENISSELVRNIAKDIFELKKTNFKRSVVEDVVLNKIFYGKIENVFNNSEKDSKITVTIKDSPIEVNFRHGTGEAVFEYCIDITKNTVYIDNPFDLDCLNLHLPSIKIPILEFLKKEKNPKDLITPKKIENIMKILDLECKGEIVSREGHYVFKSDDKNVRDLEVQALSTGLKTFATIKRLLLNGSIEINGVLILDEPEVHLHPDWQNKFAEIIVLLQKEFNLHILVNTHSTYFVTAIDNFSKIHGIKSKCHFYFLHKNKDDIWSEVQDVSNDEDLSKIYASFYNAMTEMDRKLLEHEEKQQNG